MSDIKERSSNFELLRIVAMFCIVVFHSLYFGVHSSVTYMPTVLLNAGISNFCR